MAPICSVVTNSIEGCFSDSRSILACSSLMPSRSARASICFCTRPVSTQPGQIALQVTPVRAVSRAMTLVRPTTACLAATYADFCTDATFPWAEAMLTIRPQLARFIAGRAQRAVWNTAERLSAMIASQRSRGKSSTLAVCWMPALFTRMSTWRPLSAMRANIRSIASTSIRSAPS